MVLTRGNTHEWPKGGTHIVHRNPKGHVMKDKEQELGNAGFDRWRGGKGHLRAATATWGKEQTDVPSRDTEGTRLIQL